jgi:molybdenum cofactor synthesis domain-containing protein
MKNNNPTVALIIIGDEILSGRTQDKNVQHIAKTMGQLGIDLVEVRVIPDVEQKIIDTLRELSANHTYVFTTGGIGPTHDDITSESVAKAFNQKYVLNKQAHFLLEEYYGKENLNAGRLKMAYVPENAELIENSVSAAPGFRVGNVFVMAGIPKIMQAMLEAIIPLLEKGIEVKSQVLTAHTQESKIAAMMEEVQNEFIDNVSIGSYPFMQGGSYGDAGATVGVNVVFRSQSEEINAAAVNALEKRFADAQIKYEK